MSKGLPTFPPSNLNGYWGRRRAEIINRSIVIRDKMG